MKFSTNSKLIFNFLLLALFLSTAAMKANADEGNFEYLYTLDIQPKGQLEFEQRINHTVG